MTVRLLLVPLFLLLLAPLEGCKVKRECDLDLCGQAWCEANTVVYCKCSEDPDGGRHSVLRKTDCALSNRTCVSATENADDSGNDALCLDACSETDTTVCRTVDGSATTYECKLYTPEGYNLTSGPHPNNDGEARPWLYASLRAWTDSGLACTP